MVVLAVGMPIFLFAGKKKDGSEKHGAWCFVFSPSIRPKKKTISI